MPDRVPPPPKLNRPPSREALVAMKARQSAKIREIAVTLASTGIVEVREQAQALGLARSTTWTILRATHKSTGLSPMIIARMLASPALAGPVRAKIIEYVEDKAAGLYGHNSAQRRRFVVGLATKLVSRRWFGKRAPLQPDIDVEKIVAIS